MHRVKLAKAAVRAEPLSSRELEPNDWKVGNHTTDGIEDRALYIVIVRAGRSGLPATVEVPVEQVLPDVIPVEHL